MSNLDYADLQKDWIAGRLYPWLRERFGDKPEADLDRDFGRMIEGLDLPEFVYWFQSASDIRRWCWSINWHMTEQDEDLFMMSDGYVDDLLVEIRKGCPKADYAYAIVVHHIRDSAHEALATDLRARLAEMGKWRPWLEHCFTQDTSYPLRLLSYAEPCKVTEEEAIQRVHDLRRCHPHYKKPPELQAHPKGWSCVISSKYMPEKTMLIDRRTGRMSLL